MTLLALFMQLPYQSINYIPLQIEKNCCTSGSVKPYSGHRYPYKVFVEGVINMTDMQNCQSRQRLELKMPEKFSRLFGAFENSKRAYSWQFNLPKGFVVSKRASPPFHANPTLSKLLDGEIDRRMQGGGSRESRQRTPHWKPLLRKVIP